MSKSEQTVPKKLMPLATGAPEVRSKGFIVRLKPSVSDVAGAVRGVVARHSVAASRVFQGNAIKGFSVRDIPAALLERVRADEDVHCVEPDLAVQAFAQYPSWAISRLGCSAARASTVDADLFVLDTGVQPNHPDLNIVEAVSFIDYESSADDMNGHGTMSAGCAVACNNDTHVAGVAPGARLHSCKVLDKAGSGYLSTIIAGIEHAINFKTANPTKNVVLNLSLGGYAGTSAYNAMDLALQAAINQYGIPSVVAAGNSGMDASLFTPAHVQEAITVGAYSEQNVFASFSNSGPMVDILAPGQDVVTTGLSSSLVMVSGTSFSAPYTAGAVALYMAANPGSTPATVATALKGLSQNGANPPVTGVPAGTTTSSLYVSQI